MIAASGRPLRFFGLVMTVWVAVRMASHGDVQIGPPAKPLVPRASAKAPQPPLIRSSMPVLPAAHSLRPVLWQSPPLSSAARPAARIGFIVGSPALADRHRGSLSEHHAGFAPATGVVAVPLAPPAYPQLLVPDRWRGSAWMLWRPDGGSSEGAIPAGRLGGSQAGVRIDYDLTPAAISRVTAYARMTSALQRPAAPETALGLAFQPSRSLPVTFAVERRAALGEGGRNAIAAMIVGGFGPTPLVAGAQAQGYAQAGVVGLNRKDAFVDGKLSLTTSVAGTSLHLGGAVSGGAQPGVGRLDIGPEARLPLPLSGMAAHLSLEWRHRVAGGARPGSGFALTFGADF